MGKEAISVTNGVCIIVMFICGSSVVMGLNAEIAQDSWLAMILAAIMAVPVLLIYARIVKLNPGKDFSEILETVLGKVGGKTAIVLMTWYAFHLGALVLRNFSEFIQISIMPETPQLPVMIVMMVVTAYMVKSGLETLGKWSMVTIILVLLVVAVTIMLSLKNMDFSNIQPVMEHSVGQIASASFQMVTLPFAETVLAFGVVGSLRKNGSPYRVYMFALLLGALIMLVVLVRNIEILGTPMMGAEYFPSYAAARVIKVGNFLSRIEIVIAMNFILAGIIKISLCLMVAAKGITKLFNLNDYRRFVMPTGLAMVALGAIVFKNTMELFDFLPIYKYYVLPFQLGIPLIVWIVAEVKAKKQKKQAAVAAGA